MHTAFVESFACVLSRSRARGMSMAVTLGVSVPRERERVCVARERERERERVAHLSTIFCSAPRAAQVEVSLDSFREWYNMGMIRNMARGSAVQAV